MIKRLSILATLLISSVMLAARSYTPQTVPNVQLDDARRFVSNPDWILTPTTVAEIDRMCFELKEKGLAQVAVLVLDEVDERDLDMFAHKVLNLWGVGDKTKDNGLVISVVKQQRDIQFETGYGLEGVLPDAICKRIQTVYMVPPLGRGEWDEGVLEGVKAVYNVLTDNKEELGAFSEAQDDMDNLIAALSLFMGVLFLVLLVFVIAGRKKRGGGGGSGSGSGSGRTRGTFGGFPVGFPPIGGFGGGGGGFGGGGFGGGMSGGGGARSGF